jgi:hypothetical protein
MSKFGAMGTAAGVITTGEVDCAMQCSTWSATGSRVTVLQCGHSAGPGDPILTDPLPQMWCMH